MNFRKSAAADEFPSLRIVSHPLIEHKLAQLRHKDCPHANFKRLVREISLLMAPAVTAHLSTRAVEIETPLTTMMAQALKNGPPVLVPILRAGLGMSGALEDILPDAQVGHIGLYRDHDTKQPCEYLIRLPQDQGQDYILIDPMLATGKSAVHALNVLVAHGASPGRIVLLSLVAAPEGVREVGKSYPNVPVFTAALDSHLNEMAYIVPGLGDAGDRIFGT